MRVVVIATMCSCRRCPAVIGQAVRLLTSSPEQLSIIVYGFHVSVSKFIDEKDNKFTQLEKLKLTIFSLQISGGASDQETPRE